MSAMLLLIADRCVGCRICELACSLKHEKVFNPNKSRIWIEYEGTPELWNPNVCRSCGKPPCAEACPTDPKAIFRDEKIGGGMKIKEDICIKCGKCIEACPFAGVSWHPDTELPLVCNVCEGEPACVPVCPSEALLLGGKQKLAEEIRTDYSNAQIKKTKEGIMKKKG